MSSPHRSPSRVRLLPSSLMFAFILSLVPSLPGVAQEWAPPPPEEIQARAREAEDAPLFASHEPLRLTLRTDIDWLRDERPEEEETPGTLTFVDAGGNEVTVPVEVRTRGNFRREKRNCNFPPLRLDVPKSEVEGTVFEGQDKLKLVTPCHDSRDAYQQYTVQEYLIYRVYQLLTPLSFRVRMLEITYEDVNDEYDTRTKTAFLIEDEDRMADRNRAEVQDLSFFHPLREDAHHAGMVAVFQYLIGNTDWSAASFHNFKLVRYWEGGSLTVPYDFDWSGVVNARYAAPDPKLPIRNVRQRLYRGFCRDDLDYGPVVAQFNEHRAAIWALYEGTPQLEDDERKKALEYYEDFYETINDERKFDRQIMRACREIPG